MIQLDLTCEWFVHCPIGNTGFVDKWSTGKFDSEDAFDLSLHDHLTTKHALNRVNARMNKQGGWEPQLLIPTSFFLLLFHLLSISAVKAAHLSSDLPANQKPHKKAPRTARRK